MLPFKNSHFHQFVISLLGVFVLLAGSGCSSQERELYGLCIDCHQQVTVDSNHQFRCSSCHGGQDDTDEKELAHTELIASPAHPDNMEMSCGTCHEEQVKQLPASLHYTLDNLVGLVRDSFGADDRVSRLIDIPEHEDIETILQLSDDMLRRRCLRCHLFGSGDSYRKTNRATGCGACHLTRDSHGQTEDHVFTKTPDDSRCLSCHYGNYVGADYHGRSEHDFNEEYRTPYFTNMDTRPYGVEYRELAADIHQQRGMGCVDCHSGDHLMGIGNISIDPACIDCHDHESLTARQPTNVEKTEDGFSLNSMVSGRSHLLPLMKDSAHKRYSGKVACQVCHGQWSFNDHATHLLRSDLDEYDEWDRLTVQGSSEIEQFLEHNLDYDNEELPPQMRDQITGEFRDGVWYKGYTMRRWEWPLLGRDSEGIITVVRPILNLSLSWIDEDENVPFDSIRSSAENGGMLPYVPHTTGPAGLFYEQRIRDFLQKEQLEEAMQPSQ